MHIYNVKNDANLADIAKLILMVESGKRLYVNGKKVKNPSQFNVYNTEYCEVSLQSISGNIFIILPQNMSIENCVTHFVNIINTELEKIQGVSVESVLTLSPFFNDTIVYKPHLQTNEVNKNIQ